MSTREAGDVQVLGLADEHLSKYAFEPRVHIDMWFQQVETFRHREPPEPTPPVTINGNDLDTEGIISINDQLTEKLDTPGTFIVAEHGKLEGDVDVTLALIDGVFKGNITASEGVVVASHAVVIGEIKTPMLTIGKGAIIEGKCQFVWPRDRSGPPVWSVLKDSLSKVWRGRIFI